LRYEILTNNEQHFTRLGNITIENWKQK
jgi:hypothetical protein